MTERLSGGGLRATKIDEASTGVGHSNTRGVGVLALASLAFAFPSIIEGAPTVTDSTADDSSPDALVED
jgi:hypothetical protein